MATPRHGLQGWVVISAAAAEIAKMREKGIAEDKVTDAIAKLSVVTHQQRL